MKRLTILFLFALVFATASMTSAADTSAVMSHSFKAELSGAKVPPVPTMATGEASFELVGPGLSGKGPGGPGIDVEPGDADTHMGPGVDERYDSGAGGTEESNESDSYKGIIDQSDSGAGGTEKGQGLRYKVTVKDIENVTAAHLHLRTSDSAEGAVIAPLFLGPKKAGKFSGLLAQGTLTDKDLKGPLAGKTMNDLVRMINDGSVYVNVHTDKHPAGEIRGEVKEVS
jgi:hypothetical protein